MRAGAGPAPCSQQRPNWAVILPFSPSSRRRAGRLHAPADRPRTSGHLALTRGSPPADC